MFKARIHRGYTSAHTGGTRSADKVAAHLGMDCPGRPGLLVVPVAVLLGTVDGRGPRAELSGPTTSASSSCCCWVRRLGWRREDLGVSAADGGASCAKPATGVPLEQRSTLMGAGDRSVMFRGVLEVSTTCTCHPVKQLRPRCQASGKPVCVVPKCTHVQTWALLLFRYRC